MVVGVPAYQIAVDIAVAFVLLLGLIYLPLLLKRTIPSWLLIGAASIAVILILGATFAIWMGHWPFGS